MSQPTLPTEALAAETALQSLPPAKRVWVLPILRVLEQMGGSGRPKSVQNAVVSLFEDHLNEAQRKYILGSGRIGWTRKDLVDLGLLTGEHGTWALTPLSQAYLEAHRDSPMPVPENVPEGPREKSEPDIETEAVDVTGFRGYDMALLECLNSGCNDRQEILARVGEELKDQLLPGDFRRMANGHPVHSYRTSWALSQMYYDGFARNPSRGVWEITEKGRERLAQGRDNFRVKDFQGRSKAKVRFVEAESELVEPPERTHDLDELGKSLGTSLVEEVSKRLQLQRGPTPAEVKGLTRNLIFYGPPGTGKTHIAKLLAQALTSERLPSKDGRWRLVQFHPSYAYEDFIQGLRPNLEHTSLTYSIVTGPFLEICQNAGDDPDNYYVLVIDEINRGDPARIFGELLYALEYRGEEVELPLGGLPLCVPSNLILLGTMNSVDRSVALVDYALRRRFGFVRVAPDPEVLTKTVSGNSQLAAGVLESLNAWLAKVLDKEHTIGHSFFLNPSYHPFTAGNLEQIWTLDIAPLLEEYFYGEEIQMREAREQWEQAVKEASAIIDEDNDPEA